jgi:hypothetical protein
VTTKGVGPEPPEDTTTDTEQPDTTDDPEEG